VLASPPCIHDDVLDYLKDYPFFCSTGGLTIVVYLFKNNTLLSGSQGLRMLEAVKNSCWSNFGLQIQVGSNSHYFLSTQ
jgi:hypothetical protein